MASKRLLCIFTTTVWFLNSGCVQSSPPRYFDISPATQVSKPVASQPPVTATPAAGTVQKTITPQPAVPTDNSQPKLAPGDVIDLKVYQEDELTSHVRVNADGTVTLALLGAVPVGGKTADEAAEFIRTALARDYLVDPHVTLTVSEFAKKRFSVMGEVRQPGFYLIPEGEKINLIQALSMAGGYTVYSRGTRIQVKRIVEGREVVLWVDAKAMARKKNIEPMEILPGDAITVNPNIF